MVLSTLLQAILPFINFVFSQRIIDEFMGIANHQKLAVYAIMAILLNVAIMLLSSLLFIKKEESYAKLNLNFNKTLNLHQMNLALENLESNKIKDLQRTIEQTEMRNGKLDTVLRYSETVMQNLFNLAFAVLAFIRIFIMHTTVRQASFWSGPWPLFILLAVVFLSVFITFDLQAKQNAKIAALNQQANQANGGAFLFMQLISDYHFGKDVRAYKLKPFLCNAFTHLWESSIGYSLSKKLGQEKAKIPCITAICDSILTLFIYLLAIMKALAGGITAGSVVLYIGSIRIFTSSIIGLVNSIGDLLGYGDLLTSYFDLLQVPEECYKGTRNDLPFEQYMIAFENVSFQYPGTDYLALDNVSFTIGYANKTAIVGTNGSGKSTAIKLLCRLYEPNKGKITINGIDIKDFDLSQYRRFISVVFQDFTLLSFTIGENVACSDRYDKEEVLSAMKKATLNEYLTMKSDQLDAYVYRDYSSNGLEISGGEAQRISIARSIYKNAPLVVMDEPTAALDPRAEADIYVNFDKMIEGKTAMYISHRLTSCRFCDNILVLNGGRLIQSGTHEELVSQPGQYQTLWEAQSNLYLTPCNA